MGLTPSTRVDLPQYGAEKTRIAGLWYRPVFTHEDGCPMGSMSISMTFFSSENHIIQNGLKSICPNITPLNREFTFFYYK